MKISKRLEAIAYEVENCGTVADIGCDHGLTLINLYRQGKINKGIACDVKKGPLNKAALNIQMHGYSEFIETRLSDGLSKLAPNEAETVIISGMGGMLTIKILKDGAEIARTIKQFILQPQHDIYSVRKFIHESGCKIENEEIVYEDGKFYNILNCKHGSDTSYSETEYLIGKKLIDRKHNKLKSFLLIETKKILNILKNIEQNTTETATIRSADLRSKIKIYEEVLSCL